MKLFAPITINGVEFKNRIVMAAMGVGTFVLADESKQDRVISYYAERARGGAGCIILGAAPPSYFVSDRDLGQDVDVPGFMEAVRRLVDSIHQSGAKMGVQLWHTNLYPSGSPLAIDQDWVAPSARVEPDPQNLRYAPAGQSMRELTVQEIESIVDVFGEAALGVKKTGADFVEVHGAHGHLLNQFFSPIDNQRNDAYGGDLNGRMRFGLDCVRRIRSVVGKGFPIFFRLGAQEDRRGGATLEEHIAYAMALESAGVDCLDISVGISENRPYMSYLSPQGKQPMGAFAHLAGAIKEKVNVPVIAVGRINTAEVAENILTQGQADLVAIGRQLICDPFWPKKVAEGFVEDIIACDSCNTNCWGYAKRSESPVFLCRRNKRRGEGRESLFPGEVVESRPDMGI